jgi:hypothetical protein
MRHRILRALVAFAAAGAVAGGGAAYAAGTHHHGRRVGATRYSAARGVTGMSGPAGSNHCPGM